MDVIKELIGRKSGFTNRFAKFQDFHNLMQFRVRRILLVSSLYDSYIFEEDGRLYELLREEYHHLNLSHSPELIQFSSGKEAINYALKDGHVDLIIATQHISDIRVSRFGKQARKAGVKVPLILLGYDNIEMAELLRHPGINYYDRVFYWLGDYRVIIGIVKYLEDKFNVEPDTNLVGVQTIILVEDNIRFYSSYLPMIYSELLRQSQSLLEEGINLTHKFLRMRARPKILLTTNYEEAVAFYKKYKDTILGIISDIDFYRKGHKDSELLCKSENALGNGIIRGIKDIVYVKLEEFNRAKTSEIARELAKLNSKLVARKKKYVLIALGRIGTKDPWLGIPVTWEQISGARAIVESNFQDMYVEPSQGSHFFHNLTSFKVGYFTVDPFRNHGFLNWKWLDKLSKKREMKYTAHVELEEPLTVKINGRTNQGVILKPGVE